jgi:hypothetical protein
MPHLATLDVRKRPQWRKWLEAHHDSASEIWLVFHKRHTGEECISYEDAVEEALCFGWIDSISGAWTMSATHVSSRRESPGAGGPQATANATRNSRRGGYWLSRDGSGSLRSEAAMPRGHRCR